jgi:hypothetical protein
LKTIENQMAIAIRKIGLAIHFDIRTTLSSWLPWYEIPCIYIRPASALPKKTLHRFGGMLFKVVSL